MQLARDERAVAIPTHHALPARAAGCQPDNRVVIHLVRGRGESADGRRVAAHAEDLLIAVRAVDPSKTEIVCRRIHRPVAHVNDAGGILK